MDIYRRSDGVRIAQGDDWQTSPSPLMQWTLSAITVGLSRQTALPASAFERPATPLLFLSSSERFIGLATGNRMGG